MAGVSSLGWILEVYTISFLAFDRDLLCFSDQILEAVLHEDFILTRVRRVFFWHLKQSFLTFEFQNEDDCKFVFSQIFNSKSCGHFDVLARASVPGQIDRYIFVLFLYVICVIMLVHFEASVESYFSLKLLIVLSIHISRVNDVAKCCGICTIVLNFGLVFISSCSIKLTINEWLHGVEVK